MKKRIKNKCIKNNIKCNHVDYEISIKDLVSDFTFWCKKFNKECDDENPCKCYCIKRGHFKQTDADRHLYFSKHLKLNF